MMRSFNWRKPFRILLWTATGVLVLTILCNELVKHQSDRQHSSWTKEVPQRKVALVLGTVAKLRNGQPNLYFQYRMEMAAHLYRSGKVKHFVLSGDNHVEGYDEPEDMRQALLALGIPDSCLHLDYAGFRTLDSVVRLKAIFGQDSAIVVSQKFHNERAIFLGKQNGMVLYGADAKDVPQSYGRMTSLREYLARVKACVDVYVLHTEPRFIGDPVIIR